VVVLGVLLAATVRIARRLADWDGDARLFALVMVSVILRFACTFLQVYFVKHYYGGVADFYAYELKGASIASALHHGAFSTGPDGISADGTVNVAVGITFAIIGVNQMGGFLVFAWLALLGTIAFYRAFRIALPGADHFRYAVLLFLMPSLVFWTAAIGKEALMTLFLGLSASGAARLLAHQRGALIRLGAGLGLATLLRPNESVVLFGALALAFLVGRARQTGRRGALGLVAWAGVLGAAGFVIVDVAVHFLHLHSFSLQAINDQLRAQHLKNVGQGIGFGSSNYSYSPGFSHYFQDAYTVFLDPLPFQAHSTTQLLASTENLVILGVVIASLGRLARSVGSCLREPYILLCLIYSLVWVYVFASLGNLGLLDRERTLVLPFFFVLLCSASRSAAPPLTPLPTRQPAQSQPRAPVPARR
jgi:Dolichyl-phosphate-mannose-protein mannosyltransferase